MQAKGNDSTVEKTEHDGKQVALWSAAFCQLYVEHTKHDAALVQIFNVTVLFWAVILSFASKHHCLCLCLYLGCHCVSLLPEADTLDFSGELGIMK